MFSALYLDAKEQDPYKNHFKRVEVRSEKLAGIKYKKITYHKSHGILWRIGNCIWGLLASLAIIPIFLRPRDVLNIFERVKTGKEIRIVYIKNDRDLTQEERKTEEIKRRALPPQESHPHTNNEALNNLPKTAPTTKIPTLSPVDVFIRPSLSSEAHGKPLQLSTEEIKSRAHPPQESHPHTNSEALNNLPKTAPTTRIPTLSPVDVFIRLSLSSEAHGKPLQLSTEEIKNHAPTPPDLHQHTKNYTLSAPPTITQRRKIPHLSPVDTFIKLSHTGAKSVHDEASQFADDQILEKEVLMGSTFLEYSQDDLELIRSAKEFLGSNIEEKVQVNFTKYKKPIIQQAATRGCAAAAAAMLIMERGGPVDTHSILSTNLANEDRILQWIQEAGLNPVMTKLNNQLETLKKLILANGSAIVSINGDIGGHNIVVDHISDDLSRVRLRDPYHGWEITVSGKTLMSQKPIYCIQIVDPHRTHQNSQLDEVETEGFAT